MDAMIAGFIKETAPAAGTVLSFMALFLVHSTLMALPVLFLARLLSHRAEVRSMILRGALVAMLAAPIAGTMLSGNGIGTAQVPVPSVPPLTVYRHVPPAVPANAAPSGAETPRREVSPAPATLTQGAVPQGRPYSLTLREIAVVVPVVAIALVAGLLLIRLLLAHLWLIRLYRRSEPAVEELQSVAESEARRLGVKAPRVLVADGISSPFLAGLFRHALFMPRESSLPREAVDDVLVHELAHLRRHDCTWHFVGALACAIFFFQPLLWAVVRRMEEASDDVCDDHVLERGGNRQHYADCLVDIAERFSVSRRERLAGVGIFAFRSALRRRVERLMDAERPLRTRVGAGVALSVGCCFVLSVVVVGMISLAAAKSPLEHIYDSEIRHLEIKVVDEDGIPVPKAKVTPTGLRLKLEMGSHYAYAPGIDRAELPVYTNEQGIASIPYPLYGLEKMETGAVTVRVEHPEFPDLRAPDQKTWEENDPIVLERGAYFKIVATLPGGEPAPNPRAFHESSRGTATLDPVADWVEITPGVLETTRVSKGRGLSHAFLVAWADADGKVFVSDVYTYDPDSHPGSKENAPRPLFEAELRPGHTVTGVLDASVPRPVTGGVVIANVHVLTPSVIEDRIESDKRGSSMEATMSWNADTTISEDGTFTITGLPSGILELIALTDHHVSRHGGEEPQVGVIRSPQRHALKGDIDGLELRMEPYAEVEITLVNEDGKPVSGAQVSFSPNVIWNNRFTTIFGAHGVDASTIVRDRPTPSEIRRAWRASMDRFSSRSQYFAHTNQDGVAVLTALPAGEKQDFSVTHDEYVLPAVVVFEDTKRRSHEVDLVAGESQKVRVQLEPKGKAPMGEGVPQSQPPARR